MTARPLYEAHVRLVRDEPLTAAGEIARGQDAERTGRRAEARAHYEGALSLLRGDAGDSVTAAMLMRRIAFTYQVDLDLDAAEDCATAALAIAEACGDEAGVGHATNILAILEWRRGRIEQAESLYIAARTSARRCGDVRLAAMTSQNLGVLSSMAGDLRGALRFYHSSLADYRALGLSSEMLRALNNLGMLYTDLERWDAAQRSYAEAVEIGTLSGDQSALITVHLNIAGMWIARAEFAQAGEAAAKADQIATTLDDHHADGERARIRGILARERGANADAEQLFKRALDFAVTHADLSLEADAARELAELYRRQARNRDALQYLARAHRLFSLLRSRRDVADVERRNARLESEFLSVVQKWGESIEAKDLYTQGHCERVSDLACALAARAGVPREGMFWFRIGALLHDVGKLVVPSEILNKPGPLTAAEWEVIHTHPAAGVALLSEVDFPGDVIPIVRSHHERWSGGGYPDNLVGDAIPLAARIVCIADVYDALTSERSYQMPYTHLEAMEIMRREVGRRFDPALFSQFEALMQEGQQRFEPRRSTRRISAALAPLPEEMDDLTRVLTRRSFIDVVTSTLDARVEGGPGAMLVLDVDLFKRVNDAFGHLCGDEVLRVVADVLREHIDGVGAVGRFAGDEFVAWLPQADESEARKLAEAIREAVERRRVPAVNASSAVAVTVTIGVSTAATAGHSFEELFAAADRAMYDAKRAGRNQTRSVVPEPTRPEPALTSERFVGRGRELEQLAMLLDESLRRRPQLLLLSGDAGVGKTTLLKQLGTDVQLRGGLVLAGQCFESDLRPPYGPWIEALSALAHAELVAPRAWTELPRLVPALGIPGPEAPPSKYALYEEVTELLRLGSAAQPLTIVLEDMQWADSAAWDLLEHVRSRLTTERILICLTVRDNPTRVIDGERRARLSRDERLRTMHLGPLSAAETRIWLESVLDRRDLAAELLAAVNARTEGNPLLVNQLLRAMLDAHALWHDGTRWQWRLPLDVALPSGSYDLFSRRISRLAPLSRRILSVAAVIGRRFDIDLLMSAGDWNEDDVLEAIDDGVEAGVVELVERIGGSEEEYSFCHGLLCETLRVSHSPRRIQRVHERIAEALERRNPSAAAQLAEHYDRAGNDQRAYTHALRAGEAAADVHATDDAIAFFQTASRHARSAEERLTAFRAVIRVAERMGAYARCEAYCDGALEELRDALTAEERLWLQVQRARVRFQTGTTPAETLRACSELMDQADALDAKEDRASLAILRSHAFARFGEAAAAELSAAEAVALAGESGNEALHITALLRHGTMILERDPDLALDLFKRALTRSECLGDSYAEARCRVAVGVACARAQLDDAANTAYETARSLAQRIHAPDLAGLAALNLGVLRLHSGKFAEAREHLASAINLFTVVHNEPNRLAALYNAASVERECGNAEAAADLYGRSRELAAKLGVRDVMLGAAAGAGLAATRLGQTSQVMAAVEWLLGEMASEGDRWFQGREMIEALFVRVALDGRDQHVAERHFWRAMSLAERHDQYGAAWFVAEVVTDLVDGGCQDAWTAAERFAPTVSKLGYAPLAARYMVLRDLGQRDPQTTSKQ